MTYQPNHLDSSLIKLWLQLCKGPEPSGANWSEIRGVREQNGPGVVHELVKVNLAVSSKRLEIGGCQGQCMVFTMGRRS